MPEPEHNPPSNNWTGRRLAEKIDRSAANDAAELVQLVTGMSQALISIFTTPFRQWRQGRNPGPEDPGPEDPEKPDQSVG